MMMPVSLVPDAKKLLISHEGYKTSIYTDTVGKVTGGVGYNFSDRGLPTWFIDRQLQEDIDYFYDKLNQNFPWFKNLLPARQLALVDMCFMGFQKLLTFKNMLIALADGQYNVAAAEVTQSKWAEEVGDKRASDVASLLRSGNLNSIGIFLC